MATTYSIFFTNSSGFDNNFAFFSAIPQVSKPGEGKVYGNVIASNYIPSDNGDTTWENGVTQTYYAWTSISPVDTAELPGTNVVTKISNSKLATLGKTGAPGSTFLLIDRGGEPTFDDKKTTYDAPDGSYQIASDPFAFQPDQKFVCGLGSVDKNGTRIPVATFAAQPNTVATITPVVKFYIAQFSSQKGTVIDVSTRSNKAAEIDFTGKAVNAAFVQQLKGGGWKVSYGTAKAMFALSQAVKISGQGSGHQHQSQQIAQLIQLLTQGLQSSLIPLYACSFSWENHPTQTQKAAVVTSAQTLMGNLGYNVTSTPRAPGYDPAVFGISTAVPIATVRSDWEDVVAQLGNHADNPRTLDANVAAESAEANGYRALDGNAYNGSYNNRGHGNSNQSLVQLLKSVQGLDLAAH